MPAKHPIQIGDVFETRLPDGRFGAIRIIKSWDKSYLVATTPYISAKPPEISDSLLRTFLIKKRFSYKNEPAWCIYSGYKSEGLRYLGNIPLTPEEEQIKPWGGYAGFSGGGDWHKDVGLDVFREWRWEYDRPAYEAEVKREREEREKARDIQPKPKKLMKDADFWKLIALLDWSKTGDDDAVIDPVVNAVASLKKSELCQFEETLSYKLFLLDTRQHAKHSITPESEDWQKQLSVDGFLYDRCVVVANGREYYQTVLQDPSKMPKDLEFEALLSITPKACLKKTGSDDLDYSPGCSYETYSNRDGWLKTT